MASGVSTSNPRSSDIVATSDNNESSFLQNICSKKMVKKIHVVEQT